MPYCPANVRWGKRKRQNGGKKMNISAVGGKELLDYVIERDFEDTVSRVILEAVSGCKDGIGKTKISRVLRGKGPGFILGKGRQLRDFYGRLSLLDSDQVLDFLESLVRLGMLEVEDAEFPRLVLTKRGNGALRKGDLIPAMIPWPLPSRELSVPLDEEAYKRLREERNRLAKEEGLPPYCVASNSSLVELVNMGITDLNGLTTVPGFGEVRASKYGPSLLKALQGPGGGA
jgi:superfamily II DNA helicase RecQ